jgi:hypothetical protein
MRCRARWPSARPCARTWRRSFAAEGKQTAVVGTLNDASNLPFRKELGNQGLKATDVPVVAFRVGEEALRGVDARPLTNDSMEAADIGIMLWQQAIGAQPWSPFIPENKGKTDEPLWVAAKQ